MIPVKRKAAVKKKKESKLSFRDSTSGDEVNVAALALFLKHVRVPYGLEALIRVPLPEEKQKILSLQTMSGTLGNFSSVAALRVDDLRLELGGIT